MPFADDRYKKTPTRRAGNSGLILPTVSLGLWHNFGDTDSYATQRAIVRRAFDLGMFHFDLANNYGPPPGSAETNFGHILNSDLRDHRDELIISTKAGYLMWDGPFGEWGSKKSLLASLDQSLKRMGTDYVDIFYSHRFDPNTPLEETVDALVTAVNQGKALYVGVSSYSATDTVRAKRLLAQAGVPLTIHQPRYSMFDRRIEKDLLDILAIEGIGSIAFSPLAQGLLTDRYLGGVPKDSRIAKSHFLNEERLTAEYLTHIHAIKEIAAGRGQTIAQLAISWVLRHPQLTSALIGASSVSQLEANLAAANASPLTAQELAALEPHAKDGLG